MKNYENIRDIMNYFGNNRPDFEHEVTTQFVHGTGLEANLSTEFSQLIKEAARCNCYNSDVIYDIQRIQSMMEAFKPGDYPNIGSRDDDLPVIAMGFRKMGVDGNEFIMSRLNGECYNVYKEYFAIYFVEVKRHDEYNDWWKVITKGYHV